jgi:hypothetical protein
MQTLGVGLDSHLTCLQLSDFDDEWRSVSTSLNGCEKSGDPLFRCPWSGAVFALSFAAVITKRLGCGRTQRQPRRRGVLSHGGAARPLSQATDSRPNTRSR